ncbi:MAG: DNA mismatch repair protein MutS [Ruminococcus sp.]|jgi:DNA mismatch repair protein MutS|nr:DNA mismatch repair protein MutS [Ruminococcus sp.]
MADKILSTALIDAVDRTKISPMMRQYLSVKDGYKEHIVFFRLGDFYEMFFDDAVIVSKELHLTLTGRDCGLPERAPMCGIPFHAVESYTKKLLEEGYRIAICEQTTSPDGKNLVEREVVRIITKGTLTEGELLSDDNNNYLAAIFIREKEYSLAFADISTGDVFVCMNKFDKSAENDIIGELSRFSPVEVLFTENFLDLKRAGSFIKNSLNASGCLLDEIDFDINLREKVLLSEFGKDDLTELDLTSDSVETAALCGLFGYIFDNRKDTVGRFSTIKRYDNAQFLSLDMTARRNLELVETLRNKERRGSLLWAIDSTKTSMGKRLLRAYLDKPLISPAMIINRLDAVEELTKFPVILSETSVLLSGVFDLERLLTRVMYGNIIAGQAAGNTSGASPRDMRSLALTLQKLPAIKDNLAKLQSLNLSKINLRIDPLSDIASLIENAIVDEPPALIKDGGFIKNGFSEELDKYRKLLNNSKSVLSEFETREREATGIKGLKVVYSRTVGYVIDVTKSQLSKVPDHYIRRQTLTGSERFITANLQTIEHDIYSAGEKITEIEQEIFNELRQFTSARSNEIQKTAEALAELDVMCSFASSAIKNNYTKPEIALDGVIHIKDGRHPVVELVQKDEPYVPNDVYLDSNENRCYIITGPNMSGKSTFMRQVALITLLAQIGSFVPASYAKISVVDKIFTRVGASDDLAAGKSTFMVEMTEVADILKNATKRSLVILDEVGRGTSTIDGVSIAEAVAEYIALDRKLGCRTLFATHYHELIALEGKIPGIKNYSVAVKKRGNDIKFLRKIMPGGTDDSYGIDVARLAGVPQKVLNRASEILSELEAKRGEPILAKKSQISLEAIGEKAIAEKLRQVNLNEYTPVDALFLLKELISLANS